MYVCEVLERKEGIFLPLQFLCEGKNDDDVNTIYELFEY